MKITSTKIIAGAAAILLLAGGIFLMRHRQPQPMDQTQLPEVPQIQQSPPVIPTPTNPAPQAQWHGAVQGRVLLADTREPVPNATVLLLDLIDGNIEGTTKATTNDDGKFDIPVDLPGSYVLRAYTDTHQNLNPKIEATELLRLDENTTAVGPVDLLLHDGVALTLRVKDGDTGAMVSNFYVGLGKAAHYRECTSDNGEVTLIAPPTAFELQVLTSRFQPYIRPVDLSDQRPQTLELSLIRGGALRGTVTTAGGEPATQAMVLLNTTPSQTRNLIFLSKTNEYGDYFTDMIPRHPDTRVTFYLPGYGPETVKVDLSKPPHEDFIDVVLKPRQDVEGAFKITGKVVDPKGKPLPDTDIYFGLWAGRPFKITSDGDGAFVAEGLGIAGKTLTLVALKPGYSLPKRVEIPLEKHTAKDITITLIPIRKPFNGHVVDELGNPLADVQIHADYHTWFSSRLLMAQTDTDGSFSVPYGSDFHMWFSKPGYHTEVKDLSLVSDKDFVLTLKSVGVIRGRVVDPKGRAVPQFRVQYGPKDEEEVKAASFSDSAGRFELDQLPSGETYNLAVLAPGYPPKHIAPVQVLFKEEASEWVIQLSEKGVVLEGKVLDLNNQPIAGAVLEFDGLPTWGPNLWVSFSDPPAPTRANRFYTATQTDQDGSFRFTDLPTDYKLQMRITAQGFATKHLYDATQLMSQENNIIEITMNPQGSLRVIGPAERSIPLSVNLFLSKKADYDTFPQTEYRESLTLEPDQESVLFEGLNPGRYQLTVYPEKSHLQEDRVTDFFTIEVGEQKEVHLGKQLTLSGLVFMNDEPLRNGKLVVVQSQSADDLSVNPVVLDTDASGRFVMNVTANRTYAFTAAQHKANVNPRPTDDVQTVVIKDQNVDADLHFRGRPGVRVRIKGSQPSRLELVTGNHQRRWFHPQPDGSFQAFDLMPGIYSLQWVTPSNARVTMKREITLRDDSGLIDLGTLDSPQTGALKLVFPEDKAEVKGVIYLHNLEGGEGVTSKEFPMKGEVDLPDLAVGALRMSFQDLTGKYLVIPRAPELNQRHYRVDISANETTSVLVDLVLPAGAILEIPKHLKVIEFKLVGPSEIFVNLSDHKSGTAGAWFSASSGENPHYLTLSRLIPGQWQLHLTYQLGSEDVKQTLVRQFELEEGKELKTALEP